MHAHAIPVGDLVDATSRSRSAPFRPAVALYCQYTRTSSYRGSLRPAPHWYPTAIASSPTGAHCAMLAVVSLSVASGRSHANVDAGGYSARNTSAISAVSRALTSIFCVCRPKTSCQASIS